MKKTDIKSWYFEKISKTDKPLSKTNGGKKKKKIINVKKQGDIITKPTEITKL